MSTIASVLGSIHDSLVNLGSEIRRIIYNGSASFNISAAHGSKLEVMLKRDITSHAFHNAAARRITEYLT